VGEMCFEPSSQRVSGDDGGRDPESLNASAAATALVHLMLPRERALDSRRSGSPRVDLEIANLEFGRTRKGIPSPLTWPAAPARASAAVDAINAERRD